MLNYILSNHLKSRLVGLDFKWCLKTRPFDFRMISHDLKNKTSLVFRCSLSWFKANKKLHSFVL
jgi:hypothetical protein